MSTSGSGTAPPHKTDLSSQLPKARPQPSAADYDEDDDDQIDEDQETSSSLPEEKQEQSPLLAIANQVFLLTLSDDLVDPGTKDKVKEEILKQIKRDKMAPYYQYLCTTLTWNLHSNLLCELQRSNEEELKRLEKSIEDAGISAGESEVREALYAKALFRYHIGDKDAAIKELEETFTKTVGSSSKIDVVFALLRLGFAFNDTSLIVQEIARARHLVESGGDWERKNLLSVYEAIHLLQRRKFQEASELFLNSIATFTAYELFPYTRLVFYAVLLALVSCDRVTLKAKILQSPEILSTIDQLPPLRSLATSFYKCNYAEFFRALVEVAPQLQKDQYLSVHTLYFMREMRVVAYTQFLESYRTAAIVNMAQAFGISPQFLEDELFKFISTGRVHAMLDSVAGIVETNRPDAKQLQYTQLIKQGDALANRIHKLTKLIAS